MNVHYINILFFALPLNILLLSSQVYNQRNHNSTTHHTTKIPTTRLLCECELYMPNYDNDPQMKEVLENFNKQTQQRFHEYDDLMVKKRQKCKDRCDKESQKIILKDKLEKELMDKFATLHTDIQSDAIPTCICEKSMADKVEKGCLRCGSILGGAMPELGSIGGSLLYALNQWKPTALNAAIAAAEEFGAAAGIKAGDIQGMKTVILGLKYFKVHDTFPDIFKSILETSHYTNVKGFASAIVKEHKLNCALGATNRVKESMCLRVDINFGLKEAVTGNQIGGPPASEIPKIIDDIVGGAKGAAEAKAAKVAAAKKAAFETAQEKAIETTFMGNQTAIIASIVAIVVIVLIMVIIYLILRYRRKKKMKKKLQYIKLLEE
ncbi:rifin [Plasmodium reichenowi]|uniref:Rifin n=1 Tax=Plasmodium reichenowi TaxID=5854 RepID=A0A060RQV6_PLARE|nr:rifin [Plasmodium reichenowi]